MANKSQNTFMPFLCRFSQNDTVQPSKLPTDPSSPQLTCIGQMKKKSTTSTTTTIRLQACSSESASGNSKSSVHSNRYKLFSAKNLISPAIDNNIASVKISKSQHGMDRRRSKSCNSRRCAPIRSEKFYMTSSDDHDFVRVVVAEELDPPLPVVKCCRRDEEVNVNLWKRRGIEMKTLQIQPVLLAVKTVNQNSDNST